MFERLPEGIQTHFAELLTLLAALDGDRGWSHLAGAFTTKTVAGREYVYFQYSDPGGTKRQLSIGPRTTALDAIIAEHLEHRREHEDELATIERLARLLQAGGAALLPHAVARVLRALGDAGMFRLGGVLVGSYAFFVVGNALGVRWPEAAWRTHRGRGRNQEVAASSLRDDPVGPRPLSLLGPSGLPHRRVARRFSGLRTLDVDLAGHVQIATPAIEADVPSTLDSLAMGFVPVPQLDPRHASTSFKVRGKELRVDLLTPGNEGDREPVAIPRFRATAAPIKFLSLLLDDAQPVPAVHARGAVLVLVPSPARFALHKLLVSRTRSLAQQTKSGKDLHQAALLLEVLAEDRPGDLETTATGFSASGPAVVEKVRKGLAAAEKRWPAAKDGAAMVRAALAS